VRGHYRFPAPAYPPPISQSPASTPANSSTAEIPQGTAESSRTENTFPGKCPTPAARSAARRAQTPTPCPSTHTPAASTPTPAFPPAQSRPSPQLTSARTSHPPNCGPAASSTRAGVRKAAKSNRCLDDSPFRCSSVHNLRIKHTSVNQLHIVVGSLIHRSRNHPDRRAPPTRHL